MGFVPDVGVYFGIFFDLFVFPVFQILGRVVIFCGWGYVFKTITAVCRSVGLGLLLWVGCVSCG